ncbi:hypothetical protein [Telluribacter sp.]|uniref:hypothetical protein n=1 Tax=Telluribacter sp. TaxID=1978767 RepID=UPI002E0E2C3B|nr:hypothetical protein [Telluribacter sp.]
MIDHLVSTDQELVCKNCGETFTTAFCNNCGHKAAHRITVHYVVHDIVHVFLHADKGIFSFRTRVILAPGIMAYEFINGKRKIFNPYQYLIFSVGIVIFLMSRSHFFENLNSYSSGTSTRMPEFMQKGMADFNLFLRNYMNIITFMALPIYAFSGWLFNRKRKENYAEHFTILVFSMSQINTINALVLLLLIIFKVSALGTDSISIVLAIASFCRTYKQFYNLMWLSGLWKGILIYTFSYFGQFLIMGLVIYILLLKNQYLH